ncbi:MAG TPA: divergent PAP2 family protein [Candidatus Eisenbacteria bacterium]|nr:divergent PAP2 family protein [Candidatus Eisenbacteria bacterium]
MDSPDSFFAQLGRNKIFISTLSAWAIAQILKVLIGFFREKRFNFKWLFRSGGMPSSHVSLSMCLTTSMGLYYGFDSGLFAMALGFAVITMFDAQGVRRHSGRQAAALNRILDDLYAHKGLQEKPLNEFLGHMPVEVYAGGALGILVALLFYHRG